MLIGAPPATTDAAPSSRRPEARPGRTATAGRAAAWSMSNSMKPRSRGAAEAERRRSVFGSGHGRRRVRRQKLKTGVEFARAEAGLVEALAAFGPAIECVEVLALVIVGAGLWRQFEMGGDHIGDIDKHGGGALLAVLIDKICRSARSPRFIACLILPAGALWPTSLRRID